MASLKRRRSSHPTTYSKRHRPSLAAAHDDLVTPVNNANSERYVLLSSVGDSIDPSKFSPLPTTVPTTTAQTSTRRLKENTLASPLLKQRKQNMKHTRHHSTHNSPPPSGKAHQHTRHPSVPTPPRRSQPAWFPVSQQNMNAPAAGISFDRPPSSLDFVMCDPDHTQTDLEINTMLKNWSMRATTTPEQLTTSVQKSRKTPGDEDEEPDELSFDSIYSSSTLPTDFDADLTLTSDGMLATSTPWQRLRTSEQSSGRIAGDKDEELPSDSIFSSSPPPPVYAPRGKSSSAIMTTVDLDDVFASMHLHTSLSSKLPRSHSLGSPAEIAKSNDGDRNVTGAKGRPRRGTIKASEVVVSEAPGTRRTRSGTVIGPQNPTIAPKQPSTTSNVATTRNPTSALKSSNSLPLASASTKSSSKQTTTIEQDDDDDELLLKGPWRDEDHPCDPPPSFMRTKVVGTAAVKQSVNNRRNIGVR